MSDITATVQWSETEPPATVSTCHELDQALHQVAARCTPGHPIIVVIYVHGYQVGIGIGLHESFVHVKRPEPGAPESCLITVGGDQAKRGVVFFFLNTRHTEIPRHNLIPTSQAREIVREFFETGRRSTSVQWEELQ
ncbi:MAG: Imm1 family immunity protein [Verrucomicrobiota bacterium]|jgi:hypothetical protein